MRQVLSAPSKSDMLGLVRVRQEQPKWGEKKKRERGEAYNNTVNILNSFLHAMRVLQQTAIPIPK